MKKLPNKLSQLLRLAIKDAREVSKNKKYVLNMMIWHTPILFGSNRNKCAVCLAGSVIANTLKKDPRKRFTPGLIQDNDIQAKLYKINNLREGIVDYHGQDINRQKACKVFQNLIEKNYNTKLERAAWKVYEKGASILEKVGL